MQPYYTTVRATNGAGQTGFAFVKWNNHRPYPPIGSKLRDGEDLDIDVSVQDMFVSANWDEFHDPNLEFQNLSCVQVPLWAHVT